MTRATIGRFVAVLSLTAVVSGLLSAPVAGQPAGGLPPEDYLRLRDAYINVLRGLPYDRPDARIRAIRELQRQERAGRAAPTWTPLGPAPIPNGQTTPPSPVSGRVTSIAVHPTNPDTVYVGTAQGGVYRSLDGGTSWTPITDGALSLAIGAVAIAPSDPTTVFVGTGEANFSCDSFFGVGLYRISSADTAPALAGPFNLDGGGTDVFTGRSISKIVVHPTDANTIFVSTASGVGGVCDGASSPVSPPARGLFRSTNAQGGAPIFTKLAVTAANGGNRSITDVVMEPGNPNTLMAVVLGPAAAGDGGVYRTVNALAPAPLFTQTLVFGTANARGHLAINKVGSTVTALVASGEDSGVGPCDTGGMLRSSGDGGQTWSAIPAANGFCGGQCFYDIAVAIAPTNAANILLGGSVPNTCSTSVSRSVNAGSTFAHVSAGVHVDTHAIVYAPSNQNVAYMGTDGGIYRSADGGATWTSRNTAGFNATQFQSLALHPTDREFMIGGTQDNGTELRKVDGTWTRSDFGDGGFALIDRGATDTTNVTMYHTYFNATDDLIGFSRVTTSPCATSTSTTTEWSFRGIYPGSVDPTVHCDGASDRFNGISITDHVLFYAPMALGPGAPDTLYFGTDKLYRSVDRGDTMTVVSQVFATGVAVSAIGISPGDDDVRIVGLEDGKVFRTTTGSTTLIDVTGPIPARYVARAVIDPHDADTAYVTLAGFGLPADQHVWKTTDLGAAAPTWTAAGHGIPDVPVDAFAVDPSDPDTLYAGTDIGVYRSRDGGVSWSPFGTGLPRVAVFDLAVQDTFRILRIATHGRGIWEIAVAANTATTIVSSPNPSVHGQPVTFTATVSPVAPGTGTPTGTVTFLDGATVLGTVALNASGHAALTTSTLAVGTHPITARYDGDPDFNPSTSSILTQTVTAFLDVPPAHPFFPFVEALARAGFTGGCSVSPPEFCPDAPVSRGEMAVFLLRGIHGAAYQPPPATGTLFADLPPSHPLASWIEQLAREGITKGCSALPPLVCPDAGTTRGQAAVFLLRAVHGATYDPPAPTGTMFADVPVSHPFAKWIEQLAREGITGGCGPTTYCPDAIATRGEMAVFLVRAFHLPL